MARLLDQRSRSAHHVVDSVLARSPSRTRPALPKLFVRYECAPGFNELQQNCMDKLGRASAPIVKPHITIIDVPTLVLRHCGERYAILTATHVTNLNTTMQVDRAARHLAQAHFVGKAGFVRDTRCDLRDVTV